MEINAHAKQQIDTIKERTRKIQPLVVIKCFAYNHQSYIRDALEGFINQQTDFRFIAIVHDDASTDSTTDIIKEYAEKYPDIIFPIYEKDNQYSKSDNRLGYLVDEACRVTNAKYIAVCEGDDYWTDPLKLQKQVHIMEQNDDICLTFHSVKMIFENSPVRNKIRGKIEDREYSGLEWFKTRPSQTASFVFRTEVINSDLYNNIVYNKIFSVGDIPLIMICSKLGKLYGISDIMSVYRVTPTGWTLSKKSNEDLWRLIKEQFEYSRFGKEFVKPSRLIAQELCIAFFLNRLKKKKIEFDFIEYSLKVSIIGTFVAAHKYLKKRMFQKNN